MVGSRGREPMELACAQPCGNYRVPACYGSGMDVMVNLALRPQHIKFYDNVTEPMVQNPDLT